MENLILHYIKLLPFCPVRHFFDYLVGFFYGAILEKIFWNNKIKAIRMILINFVFISYKISGKLNNHIYAKGRTNKK